MKKSLLACVIALLAVTSYAAGIVRKPGLWEVRIVKQVVDGRDTSDQMAAARAQMEKALANMPAAQRAQMQAMLASHGLGGDDNGGFRICVSPEMAKRDTPIIDKNGRCQPVKLNHSGNQATFEFSCTVNGNTMTGKGEATITDDLITTRTDVTTHTPSGATHLMQNETQMKYLGPDCGDVKPPEPPSGQ